MLLVLPKKNIVAAFVVLAKAARYSPLPDIANEARPAEEKVQIGTALLRLNKYREPLLSAPQAMYRPSEDIETW